MFLLGHSAGGVVSCTYALDRQNELTGLICESFANRVPAPGPVLALIKGEIQPARTGAALLRATDRMTREFGRITLPVFIMHGTADKATMPVGSQFFHDHAGSSDKSLKLYDGHFHDLLNDIGKEQVMADVVEWIGARLPAGR